MWMHLLVHIHAGVCAVHMRVSVGAHMRSRRHTCECCVCEPTPMSISHIATTKASASIMGGTSSKGSKAWNFWNSPGVAARLGVFLFLYIPTECAQGLRTTDRPAWDRHFPYLSIPCRPVRNSPYRPEVMRAVSDTECSSVHRCCPKCSVFISMLTF